jgi:formate C-acetyltransferase
MQNTTQRFDSLDTAKFRTRPDTARAAGLRARVRTAMEHPPLAWKCPARIPEEYMAEPLGVRKARAIALKLSCMQTDLWEGQLFAGSMTLEEPRLHMEYGFPDYVTDAERQQAALQGSSIYNVFGHIVPDYPALLAQGLRGIRADADTARVHAKAASEQAFLDSVSVAIDGVIAYAQRLAERCDEEAQKADSERASELRQMAANLRQAPAGPARTFWQALQSVWLLHMVFHSTLDGNAMGRLDQYVWPYLQADLQEGRLTLDSAAELLDCFCLKFNERAKTTEDQRPEARSTEVTDEKSRSRHRTSSQIGTHRDGLDATNHWLQNIILGGLRPDGTDGTNPLSFLLLESYRRNAMTNPLLTVRVHRASPETLVRYVCDVLKDGGGMPAIFNDEALIPALQRLGIPEADARDYTNDGCWEVILPGRTDFRFQRISLMLCLERALGQSRFNTDEGPSPADDPGAFSSYEEVWQAFLRELDIKVARVVKQVVESVDDRSTIAPVPLLSALIDGAIAARKDMTAGGAKYRTYGMLAEGAAHAIDSLTALKTVIFEQRKASMAELCAALKANFEGYEYLQAQLSAAPKYGNDDARADSVGQEVINAFTAAVAKHAQTHDSQVKFACGVGTFSWYIGIGEGLAASADGRFSGEPVSSNFSPALGRDLLGIPASILSYSKMCHEQLPAGGPLDLRLSRKLVLGEEGTARMAALIRGFVKAGGAMMTLTVADTEELRAAQRDPDKYKSLRVRMGGWCAYFTMLSREQQEHHIRRQEKGA